ncbi:SusC/RagA family TonB-linked outer membrane protein [Arachidicoccus terrestris]|uniref:SusC/RagA family TonB-linked outer membrane protein n=1 Tax=Arachidicoccus terrestris TaxID=2875539 RepID=UPI001CC54A3D|nr:SusC/RagA family TonB-linked outer membrane protein [Arachidicoccus terrestris]UAY55751.1 SusC/RagA family TonB-linked outer membrane protein [Arachidicoccus terrestris]
MKLIILLLTVACLHVSASGLGQRVTLNKKNAPLSEVVKAIQRQSGYQFFYKGDELNHTKVSVELKNATVQQAMDQALKGLPFSYKITNKIIVIQQKAPAKQPKPQTSGSATIQAAADHDVRVHVTDSTGEPLSGASVIVKGTTQGGMTDQDGNITLSGMTGNEILSISYSGYESQEININNRETIMLVLQQSTNILDETQVIAYGTTTRRLSTGNISTIKAEDIEKSPVSNVLLAMEGRMPGIFISQTSGIPGSAVTVQIQGRNSIQNGNSPLYVVDGVPYPAELDLVMGALQGGNPLNYLNPQDIESVDVLKDADATAIYGSRAANGAILITTKKGLSGQVRVNLNLQSGIGQVTSRVKMMNTQQYLEMRREAYKNDGLAVPSSSSVASSSNYDLTVWDQSRYTDWQKVLIGGTAHYTDLQGSVSGGNDNTNFHLGTNYHKETTVFPGDFSDSKGSVYFNANTVSSNKKFRLQFSSSYQNDESNSPYSDYTEYAVKLVPNSPALYQYDGSLNWEQLSNGNATWTNPLFQSLRQVNNKSNNLLANSVISYEIFNGLQLKSSLGYNHFESYQISTKPKSSFAPQYRNIISSSASYGNSHVVSWIIEPQLTYNLYRNYGKFNFLIGTTFQRRNNNATTIDGTGYIDENQLENMGAAATLTSRYNLKSIYNYNALFGRIRYNYKDKYLVNISSRRDGSSRFGSKNLFKTFYALGAAWIFSNEKWFQKTIPAISFAKVKLSYGATGNDQIGDYQFLSLYNSIYMDRNYGGGTGIYPVGIANPYIQWEFTKKINLGLNLNIFDNRVMFEVNAYRNRSSNQLINYVLPIVTGFSAITDNFDAIVENSGLEFSVTSYNIKSGGFSWTTNLNLSKNRNELISFPGLSQSSYANRLVVGQPIGILKAYKFAGVNPETGVYQFTGSDKKLTSSPVSPDDQFLSIDLTPKYYGGIQNNFTYKGFSLDILLQFVNQIGDNGLNQFGVNWPGLFGGANNNQPINVLNRWKTAGDHRNIERVSTTADYYSALNYAQQSDAAFVNASYIRMKNISLSWRLPESLCHNWKMNYARLYIQGQNLLTISKYTGLDPETISSTTLPPLRILTVGVQIGL